MNRESWIETAILWADAVRPERSTKVDGERLEDDRDIAFLRAMDYLVKFGEFYADGFIPERLWQILLPPERWLPGEYGPAWAESDGPRLRDPRGSRCVQ